MKLFFFIFVILIPTEWIRSQNVNSVPQRAKGVIPLDLEFHHIAQNPGIYKWYDLDKYYREVIMIAYKDTDFFTNLQDGLFFAIVEVHKMDESADVRTLSFYLNEMHGKDYLTSIGAYIKCLEASSLDKSSIKRMAMERYERNMAYIKDNFENPDTIFKLEGAQQVLKNYIESK